MIHETAILHNEDNLEISDQANIGPYCFLSPGNGRIVIDKATLTCNVSLFGHFKIHIGGYVLIGPNVVISTGNHNYRQLTKPMMSCQPSQSLTKGRIHDGYNIKICNDSWIGANSVITDGVCIGEGAVVGAGSIVTKSVEPYDIVIGNPARVVGNRKIDNAKLNTYNI